MKILEESYSLMADVARLTWDPEATDRKPERVRLYSKGLVQRGILTGWSLGLLMGIVLATMFSILTSCATYQVLDGRRVPRHPRPDSAATFPMR